MHIIFSVLIRLTGMRQGVGGYRAKWANLCEEEQRG